MRRPEFNWMNASRRVVSITTGNSMFDVRCLMFDVLRGAPRRSLITVLATLFLIGTAFADSPSVTAVLNSSETVVGETVQLQIRLKGARGADAPERIAVDGLEIRRTG